MRCNKNIAHISVHSEYLTGIQIVSGFTYILSY